MALGTARSPVIVYWTTNLNVAIFLVLFDPHLCHQIYGVYGMTIVMILEKNLSWYTGTVLLSVCFRWEVMPTLWHELLLYWRWWALPVWTLWALWPEQYLWEVTYRAYIWWSWWVYDLSCWLGKSWHTPLCTNECLYQILLNNTFLTLDTFMNALCIKTCITHWSSVDLNAQSQCFKDFLLTRKVQNKQRVWLFDLTLSKGWAFILPIRLW